MTGKKILSALYESAKGVLMAMTGLEVKLLKITPVDPAASSSEYGVFLKVTGFADCSILMDFDLKTGLALASRLAGKNFEGTFSEEAKSALCELGNIVIGNAMTSLDSTKAAGNVTPPSFTQGRTLDSYMPKAPGVHLISLDVEVGILKIFVSSRTT